MSDSEPISLRPRLAARSSSSGSAASNATAFGGAGSSQVVAFDRRELKVIFDLYGRKVAAGDWRDYALDFLKERAVFSVFRRTAEVPLYRIEKNPAFARKQGAYAVIAAGGLIVKRGHDLKRVLQVLESQLQVV